jgi:hypothetical protein
MVYVFTFYLINKIWLISIDYAFSFLFKSLLNWKYKNINYLKIKF